MPATSLVSKQRRRRSEAEWRELVERFEGSGQTRERFCAEQGVALSSLGYWRRKVHQGVCHPPAGRPEAVFVELQSAHSSPWDVELELGAGMVLRVRRQGC